MTYVGYQPYAQPIYAAQPAYYATPVVQPIQYVQHHPVQQAVLAPAPAPAPAPPQIRTNSSRSLQRSPSQRSPSSIADPSAFVIACTDESLKGVPNWDANIKLVDYVNKYPNSVHLVLDTLKKRLLHKDHAIGLTAIALLEALVKNCPVTHDIVGTTEFLHDFMHVMPRQIRKPTEKSIFRRDLTRDVLAMERYDRVLVCIHSWGTAFDGDLRHIAFVEALRKLQRQGVKFAEPDKNELAPVFTPPVNTQLIKENQFIAESQQLARSPSLPPGTILSPPPIYADKPRLTDSDLQTMFGHIELLVEMIDHSDSPQQLASDALASQLAALIRQAESVCDTRLTQQNSDEILSQLLMVKDMCADTTRYYQGVSTGKMRTRPAQREMQQLRRAPSHSSATTNRSRMNSDDEKRSHRVTQSHASLPAMKIDDGDNNRRRSDIFPTHVATTPRQGELEHVPKLARPPSGTTSRSRHNGSRDPGNMPAQSLATPAPAQQSFGSIDLLTAQPPALKDPVQIQREYDAAQEQLGKIHHSFAPQPTPQQAPQQRIPVYQQQNSIAPSAAHEQSFPQSQYSAPTDNLDQPPPAYDPNDADFWNSPRHQQQDSQPFDNTPYAPPHIQNEGEGEQHHEPGGGGGGGGSGVGSYSFDYNDDPAAYVASQAPMPSAFPLSPPPPHAQAADPFASLSSSARDAAVADGNSAFYSTPQRTQYNLPQQQQQQINQNMRNLQLNQ